VALMRPSPPGQCALQRALAPNPLSMFTTVKPGAQELSMVRESGHASK